MYFGCSFSWKHWEILPQKAAESSLEICKTPWDKVQETQPKSSVNPVVSWRLG